jgi:hypothetical protein
MTRTITVLLLLLGTAAPTFAQQSRANPYTKLFQPTDLKQVARAQASSTPAPQPRVVCGMKLIPTDPNIDPKIFVPPPADSTRYTMRVVPPTVCK